jgi:hypothetical protein
VPAVGRYVKMKARASFEAGPNGLDLLVLTSHRPGDAVMDPDFWPA